MKPARWLLVLSVILSLPFGLLVPRDASATVQRVTLVEEFGFAT